MKDSPVSALKEKKNRRGLLALIGAGGAAAVAALLGRSNGAEAATTPFTNNTSDPTVHCTNTDVGLALLGESNDGDAVKGKSSWGDGVVGETDYWNGVYGASTYDTGVKGDGLYGVHGLGQASPFGIGVLGEGYWGISGGGKIGVRGVGTDATSVGVKGHAEGTSGKVGTWGYASGSGKEGVRATGTSGAAALSVQGRALFSNAGTTIISKGQKVKLVTIGGEISPNAMILGTLQEWPGNFVCVRYCGRVSAHSFYIVLTGEPARNVKVGYMIIG